jgi:trehalose utilization protein
MADAVRVTIWNEYQHERENPRVADVYPEGIHEVLAGFLGEQPEVVVRTATLDQPEHGLSDEVLAETDVLIWWGHRAHDEVDDAIAARVAARVHAGMGFIALHSAHFAKPFKLLMGTTCALSWRDDGEKERIWTVRPSHPIAAGLPVHFELEQEEMYGEPYGIPEPDELIFISWFAGGEVFRSGATWQRGHGRVFYFRPGHETFPTYFDANVQTVIINAVRWARPTVSIVDQTPKAPRLEP